MHKIAFLIAYFGKWPEWMPLFIDSIERNSTVDFHFITDCDTTISSAENVIFHKSSFEEYVSQAQEKLGVSINIPDPYKICDLRPFFGIIHADIINGYDFFGWTDIDLLFGDIRSFYSHELLAKYDVLSSHEIRLAGHCALLRTTKKFREMGYKVYDWKKALLNPKFVGIDEHGMTNALCMTIFDRIAEKFKFSTNNFLLRMFRKSKTRKYYFTEQYSTPFIAIPWIDGSVYNDQPSDWSYDEGVIRNTRDQNRKFMYLHFMNFKSSLWRKDQSKAPWEDLSSYCSGEFSTKVSISTKGIIYQ